MSRYLTIAELNLAHHILFTDCLENRGRVELLVVFEDRLFVETQEVDERLDAAGDVARRFCRHLDTPDR